MPIGNLIGGIGLASAGLLAASTAYVALQPVDYSKMPPKASDVHAEISAVSTPLSDAIAAAQEATSGVVHSAAFTTTEEGPAWDLTLYSAESKHHVVINAATGDVTTNEALARFPGEAFEGELITLPSGLMYADIVVGDGAQPKDLSSEVTVHYSGWLVDGTLFDSSHTRGQSISFPLSNVIKGWSEGVSTMKIGGKRKLIIPSNLGYGPRGNQVIPPSAMLIFDVELLDVKNSDG